MKKEHSAKRLRNIPLIDFGLTPSPKIIRGKEFHERVLWMVHLRWLVIAGLVLGLPVGQKLMGVHILTPPLIILTGVFCLHNLLSHITTRRIAAENDRGHLISANVQISIDLLLLTLFIHFSGGYENPFIVSYVYHMVIAAIILTAKTAYFQALWASILLGTQIGLTQSGVVDQPHIDGFLGAVVFHEAKYVFTSYIIWVFTLFLVVYMTYSISKELKSREERLEETNEMLREKDRLKSKYVLALSHDLKQPLSAAQANLRLILDGYMGDVGDEVRVLIEKAERRILRLVDVIRDLLNLSALTSTRSIEKEEVELGALVREIGERAEGPVQAKSQVFELSVPDRGVSISANAGMLKQAVWNLVDNAVKYSPEEGCVGLRLEEEDERIVIVVEDTGIGIPADDVGSVFGDFYRAENAIGWDEDGTGLGLAIVKHTIEVHGGRIEVVSPRPELADSDTPGTRIEIIIPTDLGNEG